jgi:NAD(P)-dependent dehydrogenase (short-subunit alcohol dehydrogenase family)
MTWDVRGKTILVTGASSGIGLYTSRDLAQRGARVVMVGRDPRRTEQAVALVKAASSSSQVSALICDFASQSAIRLLADTFRAGNDRLDVLVNNAGGVNKTRSTTADGIETTFAVNHLGPFLLTNLLLDMIVASAPARIVTVASVGHVQGNLDFDDLGFERGYSIMRAYGRSKLANILFANELARRLEGTGVTSNSLHPGSVNTRIWSGAPWWAKPFIQMMRPFFISAEAGAGYVVALVTRPDLSQVTGRYFDKDTMTAPSQLAQDRDLGRRLWEVSAAMVGVR